MTTQEKMTQYQAAVLAWLISRRDFPTDPCAKPDPKSYGLSDEWAIKQAESRAWKQFSA